ncbi:hypothetical protein D3C78_1735380 [compost metagenome]
MFTGFLDRVDNVKGVMKSPALLVIITLTSAPALINKRTSSADLYEAILPQIPTNIFLDDSIHQKCVKKGFLQRILS